MKNSMERKSQKLIERLKILGERITPVREEILESFCRHHKPQTSQELLLNLEKKGFKVNKTTVYRQLEVLAKAGLIKEIFLADRAKYYELISEDHHHHLICRGCNKIEDVDLDNDLDKQEQTILKKNHFKVLQHSLEFFGLCNKCQ